MRLNSVHAIQPSPHLLAEPMPPVLIYLLFMGAIVGFGVYITMRLMRAVEQRALPPAELQSIVKRLDALEDRLDTQVEELSRDVQRLTEGQQFTEKLIASRRPTDGASEQD